MALPSMPWPMPSHSQSPKCCKYARLCRSARPMTAAEILASSEVRSTEKFDVPGRLAPPPLHLRCALI